MPILNSEVEDIPSWQQRLTNWSYALLKIIDIRLAIVVGITAFLLAVGIDSSGNLASAADYAPSASADFPIATDTLAPAVAPRDEASYLEYDPAIAARLRHGEVTSAILVGNRLTRAHFFTDLQVSP